jgi:hypothetical protein
LHLDPIIYLQIHYLQSKMGFISNIILDFIIAANISYTVYGDAPYFVKAITFSIFLWLGFFSIIYFIWKK